MICSSNKLVNKCKKFPDFFSMECPVCQAKVIPVRLELSWVCWRIRCAAASFEATVEDRRLFSYLPRPSAARAPRQIVLWGNGDAIYRWAFRRMRRIWRRAEEDTDWLKRETKRLGSRIPFVIIFISKSAVDPAWNNIKYPNTQCAKS